MRTSGGHLIAVVGPSGAGKDSVIRGAMKRFAGSTRTVFPRRVVTRKADVTAEDHDSLSQMAFALAVAKGDFALWWEAHDKAYGIPASIEDDLARGRTVIFNCSRAALGEAASRFPKLTVVEVTASEDVLVDRIVARGRESRAEALLRVSRTVPGYPAGMTVVQIDNNDALERAVSALCDVIVGTFSVVPLSADA